MKIFAALLCALLLLCGCSQGTEQNSQSPKASVSQSVTILEKGDFFFITGVVNYSDEPSDIGQEYCFITTGEKVEYNYIDIYGETSKWSSDVFCTKGEDTTLMKDYVGKTVTISGVFDAESHGIPYITNIIIE